MGIIEFIGAYWQILLALAAVGVLVYVVFNFGKKPANIPEENFKYEIKQTESKLPPRRSEIERTRNTNRTPRRNYR